MKRTWMIIATVWLGLACAVQAQDAAAAKQRMADRLPAVVALLSGKTVGENRAGYLEALGKLAEADQKTVAAENADRKEVYAGIATRTQQPVEEIGRARAEAIAARAPAGTMLQGRDGKWAEKK
jgi:uncharacterized protein YdbL (DUF1318 family)